MVRRHGSHDPDVVALKLATIINIGNDCIPMRCCCPKFEICAIIFGLFHLILDFFLLFHIMHFNRVPEFDVGENLKHFIFAMIIFRVFSTFSFFLGIKKLNYYLIIPMLIPSFILTTSLASTLEKYDLIVKGVFQVDAGLMCLQFVLATFILKTFLEILIAKHLEHHEFKYFCCCNYRTAIIVAIASNIMINACYIGKKIMLLVSHHLSTEEKIFAYIFSVYSIFHTIFNVLVIVAMKKKWKKLLIPMVIFVFFDLFAGFYNFNFNKNNKDPSELYLIFKLILPISFVIALRGYYVNVGECPEISPEILNKVRRLSKNSKTAT